MVTGEMVTMSSELVNASGKNQAHRRRFRPMASRGQGHSRRA
jgi:hypothetical protein